MIPPAGTFDYWTDASTLFLGELVLMGFAETRRLQDYNKPGSQASQYFGGVEKVFGGSGNPAYPGGQFFNMAGLGKTEAELKKLKANEIENGRLAMLAMLGYFIQASFTHQGATWRLATRPKARRSCALPMARALREPAGAPGGPGRQQRPYHLCAPARGASACVRLRLVHTSVAKTGGL